MGEKDTTSPPEAGEGAPQPARKRRRAGTRRTRFLRVRDLEQAADDLADERRALRIGDGRLHKLRLKALQSFLQPLRARLQERHPGTRPQASLRCFEGGQSGEMFSLPEGGEPFSMVLGRDERTDLEVRDPEVSRAHCRLESKDGWTFMARDLGSKNGTLLNGVKIDHAELHGGDALTLGLTFFLFEMPEVALALELDDAGLGDPDTLRAMLRFEALVSGAQERLAAVRHDLIQLDIARREHEDDEAVQRTVAAFRKLATRLLREARAKTARAESALAGVLGEELPQPAAKAPEPGELSELARLEAELNQVVDKLRTIGSRSEGRPPLLRRQSELIEKVEETRKLSALGSVPKKQPKSPRSDRELEEARARIAELEHELALRPEEVPDELRLVAIALDHERGGEVKKLSQQLAALQDALRQTEARMSEKIARYERSNLKLRTAHLEVEGRLREAVRELVLQAEVLFRGGQLGHARDLAKRIVAIDPASDAARYLLAKIEPAQTSGSLRASDALGDRVPLSDSQLPPAPPASEDGP